MNRRYPRYPDEADYQTNAPSYYEDLARKNKLLKMLAKKIWEYDERLNDRLDELNDVLSDYLDQWDDRIENLDKEVEHIFIEWLEDGTLEQIINHEVLGNKLDKKDFEEAIQHVNDELGNKLDRKYFEDAIQYVTYDMFFEEGLSDNEIIYNAHKYANENNLPVINLSGEYWLDEPINIPIKTNVNFGKSIFHIDESKSKNGFGNFNVLPSKPKQNIQLDATKKSNFISQLKKGRTVLNDFPEFKNHLVRVVDNNTNQFQRYLAGEASTIWKLEDLFYVGEGGRIDGTIKYNFNDYTNLELYYAEEDYLIIEGGTFILNGEGNRNEVNQYVQNGFKIERSRVRFRNQFVGMEGTDKIGLDHNFSSGFYYYSYLYDIEFDNIKGLPRVDYHGTGTYGFYGHRVVKIEYNKVYAVGNKSYWGLNAHNKVKDIKILHSRIGRIDSHYDMQNLTITHSEIDRVALNGGGLLDISHSIINDDNIVEFRLDYGGHWDGDISVDHVTLKPSGNSRLISFRSGGHDHLSDIVWGRNISLSNITVDMQNTSSSNSHNILYLEENGFQSKHDNQLTGFDELIVKDLNIINGKGKGFALGHIGYPHFFDQRKSGGYSIEEMSDSSEITIDHNTKILIERVDTTGVVNFVSSSVSSNAALNAYHEYSLYPKLTIIDSGNIHMLLNGMVIDIDLIRSTLRFVRANLTSTIPESRTKLNVYDSIIKLRERITQKPIETNLFNVIIKPNENDSGVKNLPQTLMNTGLFQINIQNRTTLNLVNYFKGVQLDVEILKYLEQQAGDDVGYELGNALLLTNRFRRLKGIQNGTTTQRPVYNDRRNSQGQLYYDRILGKTIMFNAEEWVNVDGSKLE